MKSLLLALIAVFAVPAAHALKAADIGSVQRTVDARYHVRGHAIPMMWMVSWVARGFTAGGVRGLDVVTYEHFQLPHGDTLLPLVREQLGDEWSLMVRDHETTSGGEDDTVWVQPHGSRVRMLVVSLDGDELDLVQMDLTPKLLARWEQKHSH